MSVFRTPLPPFAPARPEEILRPVRPWFVVITLAVAFGLNLIPVTGLALDLRPDFLALAILYWCILEPRFVGVGVAWMLGLLMDVADATLFGQHALAYALLACLGMYYRRRVLRFRLGSQALHVAVGLLIVLALVLLIRLVGGAAPIRFTYFLSALTGALVWPALAILLQWPQRPPPSPGDI